MVLKMGFSFVTVHEPRGNPFYLFNCNFRVDLKGSRENISEMLSSVSLGNTLPFLSRCGGSLEFRIQQKQRIFTFYVSFLPLPLKKENNIYD